MWVDKPVFEQWHEIPNYVVCATNKASDQPAHTRSLIRAFASCLHIFSVELLIKHPLEILSLKGGCTGSSESTLVKMPHCWKSHFTAHFFFLYFVSQPVPACKQYPDSICPPTKRFSTTMNPLLYSDWNTCYRDFTLVCLSSQFHRFGTVTQVHCISEANLDQIAPTGA